MSNQNRTFLWVDTMHKLNDTLQYIMKHRLIDFHM